MLCEQQLMKTIYRDMQKVFGHYNFLLYISYKTTFFSKHYSKVNSCSILMKFVPTKERTYIVVCDYLKKKQRF